MPFDQYRWQQASISIDQGEVLLGVAATPFGLVASGARLNIPTGDATFGPDIDPLANMFSGSVYTSVDGQSWTRRGDGPEFRGARIVKVTAHDSAAFAFGIGGICLPDACGGLPPNGGTIVWTSTDGVTWARLTDTGLSEGATNDVVEASGDLVAVGFVADTGSKRAAGSFDNPTDAAVWRSSDGRHWTEVSGLPVADRLSHVWADGSRLIALGARDTATVVWKSFDAGLTWAEGPEIGDDCCSSSASRNGLVVLASSTSAEVSDRVDGIVSTWDPTKRSWARSSPTAMHDYRPIWVQTLGRSFVIFGWTVHRDSLGLLVDDRAVAFSSPDGLHWVRADLPPNWEARQPISVAGAGGNLIALLGPTDTLNGPPTVGPQSIWIGIPGG